MAKKDFWNARLDLLKTKMGWTDVAVARRLEMTPAMLGHVRAGRRLLPTAAKFRLLDALGYQMTRDLLLRLLPSDVGEAIRDADNLRLNVVEGESDNAKINSRLGLPPKKPS